MVIIFLLTVDQGLQGPGAPLRAAAGEDLPRHAQRLQGHEREHHSRHHTQWRTGQSTILLYYARKNTAKGCIFRQG